MASSVKLKIELEVSDIESKTVLGQELDRKWSLPSGLPNGQRQPISLTASAFTSITVPSGVNAVMLVLGAAFNLVLKGITGDTGINLVPTTNPLGIDVFLPLGASPSLGILNNHTSAQTIEVIFL